MITKAQRGLGAHQRGLAAEEAAARLIEAQGGAILARRHRTPYGEIDLIAQEPGVVAFVEVKTRATAAAAAFAVSARQRRRLVEAAVYYFAERGVYDTVDMRFDVIIVDAHGQSERLCGAFRADDP